MVIGFRSFTDGFAYVILNGTQAAPSVVAKDRVVLPKNQTWAASLSWVRKQLREIIQANSPTGACIKTVEPMAKKKSIERLHIEAVIIEYLHSSKEVDCCRRIKSQLKRDIKGFNDAARYIERVLSNSESLQELNTPQFQEATLAAVSELPGN
jgi:hypothetical protein